MHPTLYTLDAYNRPRPAASAAAWLSFMSADRVLESTKLAHGVKVVTTFTGLSPELAADPLLWETKVVGGAHHDTTQGHRTRAQAVFGHWRIVGLLKSGLDV